MSSIERHITILTYLVMAGLVVLVCVPMMLLLVFLGFSIETVWIGIISVCISLIMIEVGVKIGNSS